MKFIHTYWSKPSQSERWNISNDISQRCNIWYYALSVAYIKRLGYEIELYTDYFGKNLLGFLPYDNIYTDLENIDCKYSVSCWAQGKIYALQLSDIGNCFIDGDVFIKSEKCLNEILNGLNYDGFFQGLENSNDFFNNKTNLSLKDINNKLNIYDDQAKRFYNIIEYPENINKKGQHAYNTGLLLLNNKELKDKFISTYNFMLNQINSCEKMLEIYLEDKEFCPDLICEQRFMYEISKDYNIGTLLDYSLNENNMQTILEQSIELGYQHVIGQQKYFQLDKCKLNLKHINQDIYNLCEIHEKSIFN